MEIFKSGLKSVLGGPHDAHQPTGAETVEKLVERVLTSTLLDDRRDACRALKALSKKFRVEVGTRAMDALVQVLEQDHSDNEIVGYALEAICNVISGVQGDDEYEQMSVADENLGCQFTEIFLKKSDNVPLLLNLIEEYDFKVRWPVVKLLTALLIYKPKELQDCILVIPMGVSRLMDLLSDTREIIRNDTLLLLGHLTKNNANIQKIVAFENAFDKLLSIIKDEGYSDGGVIVEDCLLVLQTLLKNNSSNQTFFREGSYIQHLQPFFDLQDTNERGWSAQKTNNIHMMLQVLRILVSPNNPHQVTLFAQKAMFQCGLFELLCNILMACGVPADILTETINTVAETLRGNHTNQEYFSTFNAPTTPPKPAIVILLMSMVNEKQPFVLRCSVLYCFQCLLYRNELCQAQIIQTLLPSSTTETMTVTVGQLLCGGLFSTDQLSNWFAAVALSHTLVDNPLQKEQLLRVQLATAPGSAAISLISQCSMMLQQAGKLQTRIGLLILMCTWLSNCPSAVNHFLSIATNIPFLTSQVVLVEHDENEDIVQGFCAFLLGICIEFNDGSMHDAGVPNYSKEALCQLVEKRIGLESFLGKLNGLSKSEHYSRSVQNPYPKFQQASDVLFDYEFCRLFKSLEGIIIKAVQPKPLLNGPESSMTPEQQGMLQQYKDLIRDQDLQLQDLRDKLSEISSEYEKSKSQFEDLSSTVQQLRDQNALLKAQKAAVSGNSNVNQDVCHLKEEIEGLQSQLSLKQKELDEKDERLNELLQKSSVEEPVKTSFAPNETDQSETLVKVQEELKEWKEKCEKLEAELDSLKTKSAADIQHLRDENEKLKTENEKSKIENEKSKIENEKSKTENEQLRSENEEVFESFNTLKKEHEELLVLLTEQGDKLDDYRKRLKALGEAVEDDDEDLDDLVDEECDLSEVKYLQDVHDSELDP